jgi:hypothetical protein
VCVGSAALGVSVVALGLIGGLGLTGLVWLLRGELRERRQARAVARLARTYRDHPPSDEPVSVAELIARTLAEGQPVRLNWDEGQDTTPDKDEWPTGVLPRVEDED